MRYAILSDIHANLEALETAVAHAQDHKIDEWIVLGDTVGYGANPNECFEWAAQRSVCLMGNHEKAVFDPGIRSWFNEYARTAIEWTEQVIAPKWKTMMRDLCYVRVQKDLIFAHGSYHEPEQFHYLMNYQDAIPSFRQMTTPVCFVGHTHVPFCFCESERSGTYLKPGITVLEADNRYILNPGSVGQPRDRDPRLSLGIFDDQKKTFEIIRLDYDNHKAADKIRKAGLPEFLANRLL